MPGFVLFRLKLQIDLTMKIWYVHCDHCHSTTICTFWISACVQKIFF